MLSIDKLNLTTIQKDALYELGNIGAGNAANALFQMVNMKVEVNIPKVEIVDINQYFNTLFNNTEKIFMSRSQINDKIQATLLLIFRLPELMKLLSIIENKKIIENKNINKLQDLSISSKNAATKLANTLMCQYIETMGNLLGFKLNIKSPTISLDIRQKMLDNIREEVEYIQKLALIINTNLINNDIKNSGLFLLIPNVKTLPILLNMLFELK